MPKMRRGRADAHGERVRLVRVPGREVAQRCLAVGVGIEGVAAVALVVLRVVVVVRAFVVAPRFASIIANILGRVLAVVVVFHVVVALVPVRLIGRARPFGVAVAKVAGQRA